MIEVIAYAILIIGVAVDQASTTFILRQPGGFYETNPFAAMLISRGIWLLVDVVIVVLSIMTPALIIRISGANWAYAMLTLPIVSGVLRLAFGIWNICLLLGSLPSA